MSCASSHSSSGPERCEDDRQEAPFGEMLEDRAVDVGDVLLEDVVEVADRLMQMNAEDESDWGHASADDE